MERSTIPSPESSVHKNEAAFEEASVLDLRSRQKDLYDVQYEGPDEMDQERLDREMEVQIAEYLQDNGIQKDDPQHDMYAAELRALSYDRISNVGWKYGPWKDAERTQLGPTGTDRLGKAQEKLFGRKLGEVSDVKDDTETDTSAERLSKLAQAKHNAFVTKVNGPAFGKRSKENFEAYEKAVDEYMAAIETDLKAQLAAKVDGEEIRRFIEEAVNERIKADDETQRELLEKAGGKKAKFLSWYANLSKGKKITYSILFGVGAAGAGVAIGAIGAFAGIAGGTAAAVAAGLAVRAGRSGKTYLLKSAKIYENRESAQFVADGDPADAQERALAFMRQDSDEAIDRAHKIKRRAVYWAVGTSALGAAGVGVGSVIADNVDFSHWWGGQAQHGLEPSAKPVDNSDGRLPTLDKRTGSGDGHHADTTHKDTEKHEGKDPETGDKRTDRPDQHEKETEPNKSDINEYISEHKAAGRISDGEGWYQTFKELGVSAGKRDDLLEELGPKLVKEGIAYRDPSIGGYGINMTENGKMPKDVLRMIAEHAEKKGYITIEHGNTDVNISGDHDTLSGHDKNSSGVDSVHNADTNTSKEAMAKTGADTLSDGEGWYQTFNQLNRAGVIDVKSSAYSDFLHEAGPKLADIHYPNGTRVAYFDRVHHEWRINDSPLSGNRLHPDAIKLLARLSKKSDYTLGS